MSSESVMSSDDFNTPFPNAHAIFATIPVEDMIAYEIKHFRERISLYLHDMSHWSEQGLAVEFEYYPHLIPRSEINKIISELTDIKCGFHAFESPEGFVLAVEFTPANFRFR